MATSQKDSSPSCDDNLLKRKLVEPKDSSPACDDNVPKRKHVEPKDSSPVYDDSILKTESVEFGDSSPLCDNNVLKTESVESEDSSPLCDNNVLKTESVESEDSSPLCDDNIRKTENVESEDSSPLCDENVLTTKRVELVKRVVPDNVMPHLKPFLSMQVDAIQAKSGRDEKTRCMLEKLQRQVCCKEYRAFNAFILSLAGTQPDLFEDICGRAPTVAESDFCVKEGAQLIRTTIDNTKHCTDSELDEQISFQREFVELAIVDKAEEAHRSGSHEGNLPHMYRIHLQEVQNKDRSIALLDVLGREDKPHKKVSIYGRAGIGKSTSLQFLAKQWALGKWATGFTLLFLLQLRLIATQVIAISTVELLSLYGLYNLKDLASSTPFMYWLKNSASRILVLIDGLDEIPGFAERMQNTPKIDDVHQKAHPVDLCVNILRGDLLPGCTVISASRPFSGLSQLPTDAKAEILGLTSAKVTDYVERRHPHHVTHIMSVLGNNPILMSVCGITFYCMLVTRLLSEGVEILDEDVKTYTRLMSFVIIQYCSRKFTDSSFIIDASSYFSKLSELAFAGIFQLRENAGLAKLIFSEEDLIKAKITQKELDKMSKTGILAVTRKKLGRYESWTAEFFHLSAQELLAVTHLLSHPPFPDAILNQLFNSGQFNLALQFIFGLHFDKDNFWIRKIWLAVSPQVERYDIKPVLSQYIDSHIREHSTGLSRVPSRSIYQDFSGKRAKKTEELLRICQLLYEGNWAEKAKDVFCYIAPDGNLSINSTKLTAIELLAVDFTCTSSGSLSIINARNAHIDDTLVTVLLSSLCEHNATTLQELHLYGNSIGDAGAKAIVNRLSNNNAESMRDMSILKTLNITNNKISDEGAKALGRMLTDNTQLDELSVEDNDIGEDGMRALANGLSHNRNLTFLIVNYKHVDGSGVKALADMLQQNTCLEALTLTSSQLGDDGVTMLAEGLRRNTTLTELILDKNEIGDKGAAAIAAVLQGTKGLQKLCLDDNQIGDVGAQAIAEALKSNTSLSTLNISNQEKKCLGNAGAIAIAEMLRENTTLKQLTLSNNSIGDDAAVAFAGMLENSNSLEVLNINRNRIGKDGAIAIMNGLRTNTGVTSISLSNYAIGDAVATVMADMLHVNTSLQKLYMTDTRIGNTWAVAIAEVLHRNTSLTELYIAENYIDDDGVIAIADMLGVNHSLEILEITNNRFGDDGESAIIDAFDGVEASNRCRPLKITYLPESLWNDEDLSLRYTPQTPVVQS